MMRKRAFAAAVAFATSILLVGTKAFQSAVPTERLAPPSSTSRPFVHKNIKSKTRPYFVEQSILATHSRSEWQNGVNVSQSKGIFKNIRFAATAIAPLLLSMALLFTPLTPASAASYGSLTDEQKMVAEAWRLGEFRLQELRIKLDATICIHSKYCGYLKSGQQLSGSHIQWTRLV